MDFCKQELERPSKRTILIVQGTLLIFAITTPTGQGAIGFIFFLVTFPSLYCYLTYDGQSLLGSLQLPVSLFTGSILLSALFSTHLLSSFVNGLALVLMIILGIIGGRAAVKDRNFFLKFIMPLFLISISINGALALYQYFFTEIRRSVGFSSFSVQLGALLLFFGIVGIAYLLYVRKPLPLLGFYGLLVFLAMGLTFSRSALVGSGAAFGILALLRRSKVFIIVLLLFAILLGSLFYFFPHRYRFHRDRFTIRRIILIQTALNIFKDHPFTGGGTGSFPLLQEEYMPEGSDERLAATPHNLFLTILADNGLIGFVALCFLLLSITRIALDQSRGGDTLILGLIAALGALFANELFAQGIYTSSVGMVVWYGVGMLSGYESKVDAHL